MIDIRYLTRGDMKKLNKAGLNPFLNGGKTDYAKSMEMVDFIIDLKYSDIEGIDDMPYHEILKLAQDTIVKSMTGEEKEVKN